MRRESYRSVNSDALRRGAWVILWPITVRVNAHNINDWYEAILLSSKSLLGLPSFCGNRAFLDPRVTTNQCPHDSDHDLKNRRLFLTTTTLKIAEYRSNMGAIWSIKVRKIWRHLATFPCINSQRHLFTSYTVDMQRHDTPPIQLVGSYSIGWALHTHTHTHWWHWMRQSRSQNLEITTLKM